MVHARRLCAVPRSLPRARSPLARSSAVVDRAVSARPTAPIVAAARRFDSRAPARAGLLAATPRALDRARAAAGGRSARHGAARQWFELARVDVDRAPDRGPGRLPFARSMGCEREACVLDSPRPEGCSRKGHAAHGEPYLVLGLLVP